MPNGTLWIFRVNWALPAQFLRPNRSFAHVWRGGQRRIGGLTGPESRLLDKGAVGPLDACIIAHHGEYL